MIFMYYTSSCCWFFLPTERVRFVTYFNSWREEIRRLLL